MEEIKNENENSKKDSMKEGKETHDFMREKPSLKNISKTYFMLRSILKLGNRNSFWFSLLPK